MSTKIYENGTIVYAENDLPDLLENIMQKYPEDDKWHVVHVE